MRVLASVFLFAIVQLWAKAEEALPAPQAAPPEVVASALAAVEELGKEVALGRFVVAIERMNAEWKERMARRVGGMAALEEQLHGITQQMLQQGISIIDFRPEGVPRSFEVAPVRQGDKMVYSKWLVLVPTVTRYRILAEGQPRPSVVESIGFQIAVAPKNTKQWSFIDGSSVTVPELRALYITLPEDLELPPVERRQVP